MILRSCFALGVLGAMLALTACASPAPAADPRPAAPPADVEARIQTLEAAIARDEEAIKLMISDPARVPGLREDPELVAIAERLPGLQAELASLRAEYPEAEAADPTPDVAPEGTPAPAEGSPPATEPPDGA